MTHDAANAPDDQPATKTVVIGGRSIVVKRPNTAQVTMMHRSGKVGQLALGRLEQLEKMQGEADEKFETELRTQGFDAISDMLDMLERLVTDPADRAWLVEAMKNGDIDLPDMQVIPEAFQEGKKKNASKAARVR